uniref:acyltransferase family protein n=1 Tax=uncultured Planktosalinus sp. TaxID=1810935 RepID=UPI0030D7C919
PLGMQIIPPSNVEIFFVLSGFLIGRILFRIFTKDEFKSRDLNYFLIRRWFRTLPNYYLALLINIAIVAYFGREYPETLWKYFFFLQNANEGMDLFFTESWSLPIEEFAYIICPFLFYLAMLFKWKIPKEKVFLLITLVIISFFNITKLIYNHYTPVSDMTYWNINLKAVVIYRIDAIYYGVFAAYISMIKSHHWKSKKELALIIGFIGFLLFHFLIGLNNLSIQEYPFMWNVIYLPFCSICIAFSLPFLSQWKSAPINILKPITVISLISYSMYLLHYSIILQLMRYFVPIENLEIGEKQLFVIIYLLLTIILSLLLYRIYEKPMMDLRDRPFFMKRYTKI